MSLPIPHILHLLALNVFILLSILLLTFSSLILWNFTFLLCLLPNYFLCSPHIFIPIPYFIFIYLNPTTAILHYLVLSLSSLLRLFLR